MPKYSIIIATYNRLDELIELIQSVSRLNFPTEQFELLISDDGSSDGTGKYIRSIRPHFNLRYIYQQNKGPGEARNHGMREAAGEYFIFIDSDCLIPPDYLQKVDDYLEENAVDAFGGPDDCHPDFAPMLKAINFSMTSFLGTGGTRGKKTSVTKFYPRSFNMGIRREVFETIGGMNNLRHGQDMDLSARIYQAGYKVGLIAEAVVYHKRRTNLKRFFKQIFNWGIARINLARTYPEMLKAIHLAPAAIVLSALLSPLLSLMINSVIPILLVGILAGMAALLAFFQSLIKYGNPEVSLLSVITLFTQVLAYGMGTWSGIFQRVMGRKTAEGFKRNYYK